MTATTAQSRWCVTRKAPITQHGAPLIVLWLLAAVPISMQLQRIFYLPDRNWISAAAAAVAVTFSARFRWGFVAGAVIGAASMLALLDWPPSFALVFLAAAYPAVIGLVLGRASVVPGRRPPDEALRVMLAPALVAGVLLFTRVGIRVPSVLVAMSWLGVTVLWIVHQGDRTTNSSPAERFDRLGAAVSRLDAGIERVGRWLGVAVGAVAMLPAFLVSALFWPAHRLFRVDLLSSPTAAESQFTRRQGDDPAPNRMYAPLRFRDGEPAQRWRRFGASALTVAVVGTAAFQVEFAAESGELFNPLQSLVCTIGEEEPVMGDDPGWPLIACETDEFGRTGQFDGVGVYRFPDFEGELLNQVDGVRKTWQPPASDRTVRVWWFGGSAAWGWWNRDDFTIPSQWARIAAERGVALEITNYAVPGWTLGQEVRRFNNLVVEQEPPDFAVFYDGGNDLNKQKDRNGEGRGSDESEISFSETVIDDVLANGPFPWGQEGAEERKSMWPADDEALAAPKIAEHAMARYARNLELATIVADAVGVEPVFLWQPLLPSSLPKGGSVDFMTPEDANAWAGMLPVAKRLLPDSVIDVSDTLDDVDRWVFKDVWHTNELGARLVAEEIDRRLGPAVDRIADRP